MMRSVLPLDPTNYRRHALHTGDRIWAETNCYTDLWIELLHAWGFEPIAALPFTLAIDFEGDQWTFFKFPAADLLELYGLDVQELALWQPLVKHVEQQVVQGRPVLVELDSYYLPDTAGTAYRSAHVKTTVAVNEIDVVRERLGYFHNQGYYTLEGEDFAHAFRLHGPNDPAFLVPYVEFVKPGRSRALHGEGRLQASLRLLRRHLRLAPDTNPFERFRERFARDLDWLAQEPLETFHQYSFATLRQCGACFELAATYLGWLGEQTGKVPGVSAAGFRDVASAAKALQFQLARAMTRQKELDLAPLEEMGRRWESAMGELRAMFL